MGRDQEARDRIAELGSIMDLRHMNTGSTITNLNKRLDALEAKQATQYTTTNSETRTGNIIAPNAESKQTTITVCLQPNMSVYLKMCDDGVVEANISGDCRQSVVPKTEEVNCGGYCVLCDNDDCKTRRADGPAEQARPTTHDRTTMYLNPGMFRSRIKPEAPTARDRNGVELHEGCLVYHARTGKSGVFVRLSSCKDKSSNPYLLCLTPRASGAEETIKWSMSDVVLWRRADGE